MGLYIGVTAKLLLAILLGGIVGFEREHKSRPAGLRTLILVCMGSALVQIISTNYVRVNPSYIGDPMRLGAQVISGIGFLGAGTIIKEGANIRGLTTAASIWAVACIGLAVGSGLYVEATIATILIYSALILFSKLELKMARESKYITIEITVKNVPGKIGSIATQIGNMGILISNIQINDKKQEYLIIEISVKTKDNIEEDKIMASLLEIEGIKEINLL